MSLSDGEEKDKERMAVHMYSGRAKWASKKRKRVVVQIGVGGETVHPASAVE